MKLLTRKYYRNGYFVIHSSKWQNYQSGSCGNIFCSEIQMAQYVTHNTYYDSEEFSVPLTGNPIIGDPKPESCQVCSIVNQL
jgi:hypothetical protein